MEGKYMEDYQRSIFDQRYPAFPDFEKGFTAKVRKAMQAYITGKSKDAVNKVYYLMQTSHNEAVQFACAKLIIDKTIPNLQATEISGEQAVQLAVAVMHYGRGDNLPDPLQVRPSEPEPSSAGSPPGFQEIPGAKLAPEGPKDNPGDKPAN
jgi:hypothetical protein